MVASCEVGSNKPDRRIYDACLARLGVAPGRALFVDDSSANVEAAAALGLRTLHFAADGSTPELRRLLGG